MATFGERVEGLTSLSITDTSAPTQEQVTEFLRDGATEVRNKHLINKPKDVHLFSSESEELASNPLNLDGAQIIDVVRESGTNNDWRRCRFISPSLQSKVTDSKSFHYASEYNPAYTILGNNDIYVFPEPTASNGSFKVYHVSVDVSGIDSTFATIDNFPLNKVYLIVLYAGIKTLSYRMTSMSAQLPGISSGNVGDNTSGGWLYIEYLIQSVEDIDLANAGSAALTAEVQQNITTYQWYGERLKDLKMQYDEAFRYEQPKAEPQQERRR